MTSCEDVSAGGLAVVLERSVRVGQTRAEVRGVQIGKDGYPVLSLLFVDEPVPERLLPPVGME